MLKNPVVIGHQQSTRKHHHISHIDISSLYAD